MQQHLYPVTENRKVDGDLDTVTICYFLSEIKMGLQALLCFALLGEHSNSLSTMLVAVCVGTQRYL